MIVWWINLKMKNNELKYSEFHQIYLFKVKLSLNDKKNEEAIKFLYKLKEKWSNYDRKQTKG